MSSATMEGITDMKEGMCRGCDRLTQRVQVQFYPEDDPFTPLETPRRVMKPFSLLWHPRWIRSAYRVRGENPPR
jgi:hypothetical protein